MIGALIKKIRFDLSADRLGPDCIFTHWKLYFKNSMKNLCKKKFRIFEEGAEFRPGAYAITCSKISLGKNVIIRPGTMLFADPRTSFFGNIVLEDNVMIGSGVHIYVANHEYTKAGLDIMEQGHQKPQNVKIGKGTWVGAKSIILPGVTIGENCVIGSGSVVTKSIESHCLYAGNPAKLIKKIL